MQEYQIDDIQYINTLRYALNGATNNPEDGLEWLKWGLKFGGRFAPPGVKPIIREIGDAAIQAGQSGVDSIKDYQRKLEKAASEAGAPGSSSSQPPVPEGYQRQPTIIVSNDGKSFSQGPDKIVPEGSALPPWVPYYTDSNGNRIYPPENGWSEGGMTGNGEFPNPSTNKPKIDPKVNRKLGEAVTITPRDPLALDLDYDGIETVAINPSNPILFDHNGDGAPSATGWLKGDDGWLVRDLDGDGKITSGRELLGVDTDITVAGVTRKATTGFEALRALDTHQEGSGKNLFDSRDAAFSQLRVWQDKNQNGVTDAGELSTLDALGIVSIQLQETTTNVNLGDGNSITGKAQVTRRVGSSTATSESEIDSVFVTNDSAANLNLADNPFYTDLPDVQVNDTARVLPDMQGSGLVHSLREAMSLGNVSANALASTVQAFATAATRDAQMMLLDKLIAEWGATSTLVTSGSAAVGTWTAAATIPNPGLNATIQQRIKMFAQDSPEMYRKIIALEQFNGQMALSALMNRWGSTLPADVNNLLNDAYNTLKTSVYGPLALQTRLKPYLSAIEYSLNDDGLSVDVTKLTSLISSTQTSDISKAITDVLELNRFSGNKLIQAGWDGLNTLRNLLSAAPSDLPLLNQLQSMGLFQASITAGSTAGSTNSDVYLGNQNVNIFYAGADNDVLSGGAGNDYLYGEAGDDIFDGGEGDDFLSGGSGNSTYIFGRGDGQDIIASLNGAAHSKLNTILFKSNVLPADIKAKRTGVDLELSIDGTTDKITASNFFTANNPANTDNPVQLVSFASGAIWDINDILGKVFAGTNDTDLIIGTSAADSINGQGGSDSLFGQDGNDYLTGGEDNDSIQGNAGSDTLDGGSGHDYLAGGNGADIYLFGVGSGQDTVFNFDTDALGINADAILLGTGIAPTDLALTRQSDDLVINLNGTNDKLTITNYFNTDGTSAYAVEDIKFADDTQWDVEYVRRKVITTTAGDDYLGGYFTNDTINGGDGNDTIYGYAGQDVLSGDAGIDELYGNDGNDTLNGGSAADQLAGGFGDDLLNGDSGDDVLYGGGPIYIWGAIDAGDTLKGHAGHDTLDGGTGDDRLYGGTGSDTYLFGRDYGHDVIYDDDGRGSHLTPIGPNSDTLRFSANITSNDIIFKREKRDNIYDEESLFIRIKGTNDVVEIARYFSLDGKSSYLIENIEFANEPIFDLTAIQKEVLKPTADADWLPGYQTPDTIDGGEGNDDIRGSGGNDSLSGGKGNDLISGDSDNDQIHGNQGNDTLDGGSGDDVLDGGTEDDKIYGQAGNDTYVFAAGDGADVIYDYDATAGNSDVISFTNVKSTDIVSVVRNASNGLVLSYGASITIDNYFTSNAYRVEKFMFSDGVTWTPAAIDAIASTGLIKLPAGGGTWTGLGTADFVFGSASADSVVGLGGNDWLHGNAGNDTLRGGDGADYLVGGLGVDALYGDAGADTYVYAKGDGYDAIYGQRSEDTLLMKGFKSTDVTFNRQFSDIYIVDSSSGTSYNIVALVRQAFDSAHEYTGVSQIVFDDKTLTADDIRKRALQGTSGSDTNLRGYTSNDSIAGAQGDDSLYGEGGDDTLNGGTGADRLEGGSGNDTYVFAAGDGTDVIYENDATAGNTDVISFTNVKSTDIVSVVRNASNGLVLNYGASNTITIDNYFTSNAYRVEKFTFSDGVTWTTADFVFGSASADSMVGLDGNDWLHGNAGNDTLRGGDGADYLVGGLGVDALYGDAGADTYVYAKGDGYDAIYGQRSEDTLLMKGFKSTDVTFNRQFSDIYIVDSSSGTSYNIVALVRQAFDSAHEYTGVSQIVFDDKTLTADDIRKRALQGTSGNDTNLRGYASNDTINGFDGNDSLYGEGGDDKLYGGAGDDLLDSGTGNDYLGGGAGNDTYLFSRGGGQDNILDVDSTIGNTDVLQFQSGIAHDQLWFSKSGNNLTISVIGTTDSVMIAGGAGSASSHIEQIKAGGKTLSDTQVANLIQAMASMTPPGMGQTTLTDAQRAQLAPVLAANWS